MRRYIFTENQLKSIIDDLIKEQEFDYNDPTYKKNLEIKGTKAIQDFLNKKLKINLIVDGISGPKTIDAIKKYQSMIGITPDGVWGGDKTYLKMPKKDQEEFMLLLEYYLGVNF